MADRTGLAEERTDFAEKRTDWAEDRTIMANERTFAGWMRTGLAAVGIGLGFNALFGKLEPAWLPKGLATAFILIAITIIFNAQRRAAAVAERLEQHRAEPIRGRTLRLIAWTMMLASGGLAVAMWWVDIGLAGR
jgi:putative membrane protein